MNIKEAYEILDIPNTSSQKDIKAAYKKAVKRFHPDVNQQSDAPGHFQQVVEAFKKLSDPTVIQGLNSNNIVLIKNISLWDIIIGKTEEIFYERTDANGKTVSSKLKYDLRRSTNPVSPLPIKIRDGGHWDSKTGRFGFFELKFNLIQNPELRLTNNNFTLKVLSKTFISLSTAMLGGYTEVDSWQGSIRVPIAPGTKHRDTIKLSLPSGILGIHEISLNVQYPQTPDEIKKFILDLQ